MRFHFVALFYPAQQFVCLRALLACLLLIFTTGSIQAQEAVPATQEAAAAVVDPVTANSSPLYSGVGGIPAIPALQVTTNPDGSQDYTVTLQILALMTGLTLLPSFVLMMTAFTRIIVVFAILRHAIGLQQTPSNQILVGMAFFLTLFIMMPVLETVNEQALQPYINNELNSLDAVKKASEPFRGFMLEQTRESDLDLFMRISESEVVDNAEDVPFFVLVPAFMTSELKSAFQIGFTLFIPFLVIDMVVASVLMAMGMMMLSPIIISLPFKIMLFVLVDGWAMVIGSLAASFGT
jgi:flagellar biosynthetic protein FliP